MLQGCLLKGMKIQSRGHKVIGDVEFIRHQGQAMLKPGEVVDSLWTLRANALLNMLPRLLDLTKIIFGTAENVTTSIRHA